MTQNKAMKGRFAGIKKTYLLRGAASFAFVLFVVGTILSVSLFKIPSLWFFSFCVAIGYFELAKGMLFKLDSSFYLGTLTFLIGVSGFAFLTTNTVDYSPFYISAAFIISSIAAFVVCKQRFHLIFAYSTFFVALFGILLKKSLIILPIFIAFVGAFLLLLLLEIIINFKRRK